MELCPVQGGPGKLQWPELAELDGSSCLSGLLSKAGSSVQGSFGAQRSKQTVTLLEFSGLSHPPGKDVVLDPMSREREPGL